MSQYHRPRCRPVMLLLRHHRPRVPFFFFSFLGWDEKTYRTYLGFKQPSSPISSRHASNAKKGMHRRVKSDATSDALALNSLMSGWRAPVQVVNSAMHSVDGGVMVSNSGVGSATSPDKAAGAAIGITNTSERPTHLKKAVRHSIDFSGSIFFLPFNKLFIVLTTPFLQICCRRGGILCPFCTPALDFIQLVSSSFHSHTH